MGGRTGRRDGTTLHVLVYSCARTNPLLSLENHRTFKSDSEDEGPCIVSLINDGGTYHALVRTRDGNVRYVLHKCGTLRIDIMSR